MKTTIQTLKEIHAEKGWNAVRAYLKKNNILCKITVKEFGLSTNKSARADKEQWLNDAEPNQFRAHLYSIQVTSRKTRFCYNRIRGQQVELL